jgi:Rps23 Pro-64 3,4-dihydroxylase Tpa1-like proline 4-hydroxylase
MMLPTFDQAQAASEPFPHIRVPGILTRESADRVLLWLQTRAPWVLRIESFYEQHEFSLLAFDLDPEVRDLVSTDFVDKVRCELQARFSIGDDLVLVDVGAHRLTVGQTIRIHNDYLADQETHRLLIQLNDGWNVERGGLLMLFADDTPESVRSVVMPNHASGFAFEISPISYHAVSSIKDGERYTLVYTFRRSPGHGLRTC